MAGWCDKIRIEDPLYFFPTAQRAMQLLIFLDHLN